MIVKVCKRHCIVQPQYVPLNYILDDVMLHCEYYPTPKALLHKDMINCCTNVALCMGNNYR